MRTSFLVLALSLPGALAAQGVLIPRCAVPLDDRADARPIVQPCRALQARIVRTHADVRGELTERVVRYTVDERFVNEGGVVGEADYVFPLPAGAAFRDLKLSINGEMVAGETMNATQARGIYEEIVRHMRDPALVEWMGSGLLRARIFPIAPGEEKRVVVRFEAVVPREGDALRIDYARGAQPRGAVAGPGIPIGVRGTVRPSSDAGEATFTLVYRPGGIYGNPYSPTHALDSRDSAGFRLVRAALGARDVTMLMPLRSAGNAAVSVLTSAARGDEGFAMITVSPPATTDATASPRDLTFVLDVSGSMSGQKIQQARNAGRLLLASLRPRDRFRLIDFSSDVRTFRDEFSYATRENTAAASRYLDHLEASGGTNIAGALTEALHTPETPGRLGLVLFVTDGMPTVGEQNPTAIAALAERERGDRRVFTFGLGADVNSALLEQLAMQGRGTAQFVRPEEDVERMVGVVASRLVDPVATDLRVRVEGDGVRLDRALPSLPADLFAGQDLVIFARYAGHGAARVVVEGRSRGHDVHWTTNAEFAEDTRDNAFVPRLWAAQRIGFLSAEKRRSGGSHEMDDEIRALGERYGIPTEFTAYLVREPGVVAGLGTRGSGPGNQPSVIGNNFEAAKLAAAQRDVKSVMMLDSLGDRNNVRDGASAQAGGHTFRLRDGRWTDTQLTDSMRVVQVQAYSASYFSLLNKIPELRALLAVGERVVVAGRGVAIDVVPRARELRDDEVRGAVKDW